MSDLSHLLNDSCDASRPLGPLFAAYGFPDEDCVDQKVVHIGPGAMMLARLYDHPERACVRVLVLEKGRTIGSIRECTLEEARYHFPGLGW